MPFLRKYNTLTVTGTTAIRIPIIKRGVVDFAVSADWTPASGDVKIAIDGAAAANVTNLPTAVTMGNTAYWEFVLTAAELSCKSCVVTVADSATKAVEDQAFIVETFGHASAMYPVDFSAAQLPVNAIQFAGQTITAAAGVTLPSSVASPTNITAGTITTVTNLTNAPTNGDLTATMKASVATRVPTKEQISTQVAADLATVHGAGSWATATGFSTHSAADVWSVGTRTITGGSLTTSPPTAAVIADAVWDEARSGHVTAGTFGEKVAAELDSAARLAIWNTLTTESFTADSFGDLLLISDGTNGREVKVTGANHIAADVHDVQPDGLSGSTEITNIENASGYLLAIQAGACADPQTASETYAITIFGSTFTVDMAGQTSTGTRTAPTLTKS